MLILYKYTRRIKISLSIEYLSDKLPTTNYSCNESTPVRLLVAIGENTNWLIFGWADKDLSLLFGYTCINGDKSMAEVGSISLDELIKEYDGIDTLTDITFKEAKDIYIDKTRSFLYKPKEFVSVDNIKTLQNNNTTRFNARLVFKGDRYGLNFCKTHDKLSDPLIVFYDVDNVTQDNPFGQQTGGGYLISSFLNPRHESHCLSLSGDVPKWSIDRDQMNLLLEWVKSHKKIKEIK